MFRAQAALTALLLTAYPAALCRSEGLWSAIALVFAMGIRVVSGQESPSVFRTAVDLVRMDVQVVAAEGKPMPSLTLDQFEVSIAGRKRKVVFAEFLHVDEGPITRFGTPYRGDPATRSACAFAFERISKGTNAHYLLGVEPDVADESGIKQVRIKVSDATVAARRWAWRAHGAAPGATSGAR